MAQVFKFRRVVADTHLDSDTGFAVVDPGWTPKVARYVEGRDPDPVIEVVTAHAKFGTQDQIAAGVIGLERLGRDAIRYIQDRTEQEPVWLHDSLLNETGERRALVREIGLAQLSDQHGAGDADNGSLLGIPKYQIEVKRNGAWEAVNPRLFPQAIPSAAISIVYDYTSAGGAFPAHDIVGGIPARTATLEIEPLGDSDELGRLWIGTRSANKHGTLANFVNIWELELGTLGTDAALAADATASPGGGGNTKVVITPGTTTWAKRLTIKLGDVTSNWTDNQGTFLQLLRSKVSAAATWEVQFRYGYEAMADADFIQGRIIKVNNTSWDFTEQDTRSIPLRDLRVLPPSGVASAEADGGYTVQIWARRISGAGNLELDATCPVPVDESWLVCKDFTATAIAEGNLDAWVYGNSPHPLRQAFVYEIDSGTAALTFQEITTLSTDDTGLSLAVGDGRMIIVYARESSSDITDTIVINAGDVGIYHERWLLLRGAQ